MKKHILVYNIEDYHENGGGLYFLDFELEKELHEKVNELAKEYKNKFTIVKAGYLQIEFKYKPVEKIIKYEPKEIR